MLFLLFVLLVIFIVSDQLRAKRLIVSFFGISEDHNQLEEEKRLSAFPPTIYPQTFALPSNRASNEEVVLIREKVSLP